jgi:uncharacterized protein
LSLYLDASVLVAMFSREADSARARQRILGDALFVSDFAAAEFSAAISRRIRTGDLPSADAAQVISAFDTWTARSTARVALDPGDGAATTGFVRRFDLGLRAPDALHISITQRLGATLFTFDAKLAAAATALGVAVAS